MLELARTTFVNNAKLALVGVAAFAIGGAGTVASVTLSGSHTPETSHSPSADSQDESADATKDATETESQDAGDTGARPTDTHGYCVSHVVAAAHAAGKKGKDVAAAKRSSCPKPAKSTAPHGKSTAPHGKSSTHP